MAPSNRIPDSVSFPRRICKEISLHDGPFNDFHSINLVFIIKKTLYSGISSEGHRFFSSALSIFPREWYSLPLLWVHFNLCTTAKIYFLKWVSMGFVRFPVMKTDCKVRQKSRKTKTQDEDEDDWGENSIKTHYRRMSWPSLNRSCRSVKWSATSSTYFAAHCNSLWFFSFCFCGWAIAFLSRQMRMISHYEWIVGGEKPWFNVSCRVYLFVRYFNLTKLSLIDFNYVVNFRRPFNSATYFQPFLCAHI